MISLWSEFSAPLFSAAAPAPLGGGSNFEIPVERLVFGLILSIALAWAAALLIRRLQKGRGGGIRLFSNSAGSPHRRIAILESRRAGQYSEVCLVSCDDREYLVAFTQNSAVVLHQNEAIQAGSERDET